MTKASSNTLYHPPPSFAKASDRQAVMHYVYILFSKKANKLYTGLTDNLRKRLDEHNQGQNQSTKFGIPWILVFFAASPSKRKAAEFEQYLKTGSGKAFKYKRLVPEALKKDGEKMG